MANIPEYIDWSSQSILFSRADHPMTIPKPGHAALVVEAQIGGYNMSKVFMDGGSGLNLIFASTVKNMGITIKMLEESDTCFHGIVPTLPAYSLGKISLNVVFGKPDNFRKERIEFEVVNWESQYHAILRRPAYAKFMAVPHYAYLKLKMPGNNGTNITAHGSFSRSDNCDHEFQKIAAKFGVKQETIDFPSKQLASRYKDFKLKEYDSIKKSKKKADDPALGVPVIAPLAVDDKASAEDVSTLALVATTPKETISTTPEIIGTSRAIGSLDKNQEKKDPPLA
jgi:hypothetical protein